MEFCDEKAQDTGINFATFNQGATHLVLGTKSGFVVYSLSPKIEKSYEDNGGCARSIVEMFEDSSLIGLIGTGEDYSTSQRKVSLFNMNSVEEICSFGYETAVISLRFTEERLTFVMENEIHIVDSERLMEKAYVLHTKNNPNGICALSGQLLAYPCSHPEKKEKGLVSIFDCKNQEPYCKAITAHSEPIAALAINRRGDLLATVSKQGTWIKVFKIPERTEEFAFRRGTYPAEITSLSFSQDSSMLCVCSDKPTIHIFQLIKTDPKNESIFASYIPSVISGALDAHPRIHLPDSSKSIAVISPNNREVYVLTQEGNYYAYDLDQVKAGNANPTLKESLRVSQYLSDSVSYL